MKRRLYFLICLIGFIGRSDPTACLSNIPSLDIQIWHTGPKNIKRGDIFQLNFNVSHSNQSTLLARNVSIIWYLPEMVMFKKIKSERFETELINGTGNVNVKISEISAGTQLSGSIFSEFDPGALLGNWYHTIVISVQLLWYHGNFTENSSRYFLPLIPYAMEVSMPGCIDPLGMADGRIKDHYLDAKTSDPELMPSKARPNSDAWCSKENAIGNHIQVEFSKLTRVTRILTWGRRNKDQWVTKYYLNHSLDGFHWESYKENGYPKVLLGAQGPAAENLLFPVSTNMLRIIPIEWKERICIRFELFGCVIGSKDNCIDPIGIENGDVPDESFTDSINVLIEGRIPSKPTNSRLNKVVTDFPFGWMARPNEKDWLQIDLGSTFKVTKVAMQGSFNKLLPFFYVTTYKIRYSNNGVNWSSILVDGHERIFDGPKTPTEANHVTTVLMVTPIYGRYFRIIPVGFVSSKVMRLELYGCASPVPQKDNRKIFIQDHDVKFSRRSVLLDPSRCKFYACFRKVNQGIASCAVSEAGIEWKALDSPITRLLGIDVVNEIVYGTDRQLSILAKRSNEDFWHFVSESHWNMKNSSNLVKLAIQLPEILIGKRPKEIYQWKSNDGMIWGASEKGIHVKMNEGHPWKTIAAWNGCTV